MTHPAPVQATPPHRPLINDGDFTLFVGSAIDVLRTLPDESVHAVVTSPPYWGLRDYGTGSWDGGDPDCQHRVGGQVQDTKAKGAITAGVRPGVDASTCLDCGATRTDQQLGLEPTPEAYVARMVEVFREVRRVLRRDGTCWLNIGDSYNGSGEAGGDYTDGGLRDGQPKYGRKNSDALKPKDLVGIPWLVARALQEPYYTGRIPRERDRVWLAATIDGEGTICGTAHTRKDDGRTRTMPQVSITNSSLAMLAEAERIWPASQSDRSRPGDGHLGTVPVYRWIVHGIENKTALVCELYPYLIVKRTQALLAYNLLVLMADAKRLGKSEQAQAVRDKREHLCALMSRLNHAETVDVPSWCVEPPSLYESGWYLRSEIIWAKPNPMPESVTDRPTKSHEQVFLLTRAPRYYFDQEAIREPHTPDGRTKTIHAHAVDNSHENYANMGTDQERWPNSGRNARSVWTIATQPYAEAHFATFPEELPRRCMAAGTSERGCCPVCGAPWEREIETKSLNPWSERKAAGATAGSKERGYNENHGAGLSHTLGSTSYTTGWRPTCNCLCPACTLESSHDTRMPELPEEVRAEVGEQSIAPSSLLRSQVREPIQCAEPIGTHQDDEGLHRDLLTNTPVGVEAGLRDGTSVGDGELPGSAAQAGRSSPSPQRDQGRQPTGESGSNDATAAQPAAEEAAASVAVPALQSADLGHRQDEVQCAACGAPLAAVSAVVLDPFAGSGTVALVARKLGRRSIGIELNPDYAQLAARRLQQLSLLA